jgi:hypothetical protein
VMHASGGARVTVTSAQPPSSPPSSCGELRSPSLASLASLPLLRRNLRACFAFGERALRARLHAPLRVHFCAAALFAAFS